jgi:hypothetical protein
LSFGETLPSCRQQPINPIPSSNIEVSPGSEALPLLTVVFDVKNPDGPWSFMFLKKEELTVSIE